MPLIRIAKLKIYVFYHFTVMSFVKYWGGVNSKRNMKVAFRTTIGMPLLFCNHIKKKLLDFL